MFHCQTRADSCEKVKLRLLAVVKDHRLSLLRPPSTAITERGDSVMIIGKRCNDWIIQRGFIGIGLPTNGRLMNGARSVWLSTGK